MVISTKSLLLVVGSGLIWMFTGVHAQQCGNTYFGPDNPGNRDRRSDRQTNVGYIVTGGTNMIADCCGYIDSWEIDAKDYPGGNIDLHAQVWNYNTGSSAHVLIGENILSFTGDTGARTFPIPAADRIFIRPGYQFGWWNLGREIVGYDDGEGVQYTQNYHIGDPGTATGGTKDWSTTSAFSGRIYAIRTNVLPDNNPAFTNMPSSTTILSTDPPGGILYTVAASDVEDTPTVTMLAHSEFDFNIATGEISVGILTTTSGTVVLTFDAADDCGNIVRSLYTITIQNPPPVFHNLPTSTNISEDTIAQTRLYLVSVTDAEQVTCSMDASVPASVPMSVQLIPGSSDWGIYMNANPGLNYVTQNSYQIRVSCTDGTTAVTSDIYWVYLIKNLPPTFTNLQNSIPITTTLGSGQNVYTVATTDPESDTLSYTMTCAPPTCPFIILDSGEVQTTTSLSGETTVGYDLFITVNDGKNSVGPSTLTVTYSDLNNNVDISNLPIPSSLGVPEGTTLASSIFNVTWNDPDIGQSHTVTMTSSPTSGLNYFSIDTAGKITTAGSILNYEALLPTTTFTFSITVSDPLVSDTETLQITVFDVNEPPSLGMDHYGISASEGSAGDVIGTPSFDPTDPDVGDTATFSMDCGTHTSYFHINPSTGAVSYQINYDLDTATGLPTTVSCVVTVTDSGGLTDTATLTITIADANDNAPVFNPDAYTFYVSYLATAATAIGSVTATDADSGAFGTFAYTIVQTSLAVPHFSIAANGLVTMEIEPTASISALNYSSTYTIQAWARDSGGLTDSAIITIVVSDTTTTTVTTTTYSYKTFFDSTENLAWLIPCAILTFIALAATIYMVHTCRGQHGCQKFLKTCMNRRKIKLVLDDEAEPPYRSYKKPTQAKEPMNLSSNYSTNASTPVSRSEFSSRPSLP